MAAWQHYTRVPGGWLIRPPSQDFKRHGQDEVAAWPMIDWRR